MIAQAGLFRPRNGRRPRPGTVAAALLTALALQGSAFAARNTIPAPEARPAAIELASPQAKPSNRAVALNNDIRGTWSGQYFCGQGVTELVLTISGSQHSNLSASFRFEVHHTKQIRGEFLMAGYYEPADRSLNLSPLEWVVRPEGYVAVGLEAKMNAAGDSLEGRVVNTSCSWVRLSR